MKEKNDQDVNLQAYLAWCWWVLRITLIVMSVALNLAFILVLLLDR